MRPMTDALTAWGLVLPRHSGWQGLTGRQRIGVAARAVAQTALLVAAAGDLLRRPAAEVRGGSKWAWAPVTAVDYLGLGPLVYLVADRRPRHGDAATAPPAVTPPTG
jgi:hypothetical protein